MKRGELLKLDSLGKDYEDEYGYAIRHHTVDLWLRLWMAHDYDVRTKGIPPPCKIISDNTTSFWNKCMGNIDTVNKLACYHKVKGGSNTGLGSLIWYMIFNCITVHAYRTYISQKLVANLKSNS